MDRRIKAFGLAGAIFVGLAVISQVTAGPFSARTGQSGKGLRWNYDLKSAHKEATASGKPILVVFGASWCTFCHKLERETLSEAAMVKHIHDHFVPVHLDFDKDRKVAEVLEVTNLPAMVVLSPDADLLGNVVGYVDSKELKLSLDKSLKNFRDLQKGVVPASSTK